MYGFIYFRRVLQCLTHTSFPDMTCNMNLICGFMTAYLTYIKKKKQHLYSNFCLSCSQAHLYEFGRLKAQTPYMALEVFHAPFVVVGFCFHCVFGATAHCPLPVQPDDRTVVFVYWSGNLHVSSTPAEKQDFPRKSRFLF